LRQQFGIQQWDDYQRCYQADLESEGKEHGPTGVGLPSSFHKSLFEHLFLFPFGPVPDTSETAL
jgi:hypothetical protein